MTKMIGDSDAQNLGGNGWPGYAKAFVALFVAFFVLLLTLVTIAILYFGATPRNIVAILIGAVVKFAVFLALVRRFT